MEHSLYCQRDIIDSCSCRAFWLGCKMKKYIVRVNDYYIKHTSCFGCWYGEVVLTKNIKEAKLWTREIDARSRKNTLLYRYKTFDFERNKLKKIYHINKLPRVYIISYNLK